MKDEYAWLEDTKDPRVVAWARRQDAEARRSVSRYSKVLYGRLARSYRTPMLRSVQLTRAGVVLLSSDDRRHSVELLRPDGTRERVIDSTKLGKNAVIQAVQARKDGRVFALHYSLGGSDEGTVAMLEVGSLEVTDRLRGFIGSVLWTRGGYYYVRTFRDAKSPDGMAPPADRVFLREGRKDQMVFGTGLPTNVFVGMTESQDGSRALLDASYGWTRSRPYGGTVGRPESWVPLYPEVDSNVANVDYHEGRHLLISFEKSLGEVLSVGRGGITRVLGEGKWPLQEAALVGDRLLCHYLVDACSELRLCDLRGRTVRTIRFPVPGSLVGSAGPPISSLDGEAAVGFSSFTLPFRVYRVKGTKLDLLASEELPGEYSVEHRHAASADGTAVHYFVTSKRGATPAKALLVGYGGFRVALTPGFNPAYLPLLEDGAALAVANLRGGTERGEEWHRAGMREKKPNVFDDFLAVLAKLNEEGMTVVGSGASNGGLLMGATMNARPDLFAGVLIGYPVLDMMIFHRLLVGRAWVPEYGDPDDPGDRRFLLKYSPYHNVEPGRRYPPVFVYTGLKDDRVHPAHAFKFYAKLKEAGADAALRVETRSGHSGATPETKIMEEADKLGFVFRSLGLGRQGGQASGASR